MFSIAHFRQAAFGLSLSLFVSSLSLFGLQSAHAAPGESQVATFTASGSFSVPPGVVTVEVLLVGAGGSGAKGNTGPQANNGGGGGGGMVMFATLAVAPASQISFNVGAFSSTLNGGGQTLTATAGGAGSRASSCYAGRGGIGYTGTVRVSGTAGSQACFGTGGDGGGVATETNFTGTTLMLGGGGYGGRAGRVGAQGAGAYGYGGGGGTTNGSEGTPGGSGFVAIKWVQPSNAAQLHSFSITGQQGSTFVDDSSRNIRIVLPHGSSRQALTPSFQTSPGALASIAGAAQVSGSTANDFSTPLTYEVTAQDGTVLSWNVAVRLEQLPLIISQPLGPAQVGQSLRVEQSGGSGTGVESILIQGSNCFLQEGAVSASQASSCSITITKEGDATYEPVTSNVVVFSFLAIEPPVSPQAADSVQTPAASTPAPNANPEPVANPAPTPLPVQPSEPLQPVTDPETDSGTVNPPIESTSPTASATTSPSVSQTLSPTVSAETESSSPPAVSAPVAVSAASLQIQGLRVVRSLSSAKISWKPVLLLGAREASYQFRLTGPNSSRFGPWRPLGTANMVHLKILKRKANYTVAVRATHKLARGATVSIRLRLP